MRWLSCSTYVLYKLRSLFLTTAESLQFKTFIYEHAWDLVMKNYIQEPAVQFKLNKKIDNLTEYKKLRRILERKDIGFVRVGRQFEDITNRKWKAYHSLNCYLVILVGEESIEWLNMGLTNLNTISYENSHKYFYNFCDRIRDLCNFQFE